MAPTTALAVVVEKAPWRAICYREARGQKWTQWSSAGASFGRVCSFNIGEPRKLFDSGPLSPAQSSSHLSSLDRCVEGPCVVSLLWKLLTLVERSMSHSSSPLRYVLCLFEDSTFHFLFLGRDVYFISSFGHKREERYSILDEIFFSSQILFSHFLRKFEQPAATWLLPGFVLVPQSSYSLLDLFVGGRVGASGQVHSSRSCDILVWGLCGDRMRNKKEAQHFWQTTNLGMRAASISCLSF